MKKLLVFAAIVSTSNAAIALEAYDLTPVNEVMPPLVNHDTSALSMVPMQQGPNAVPATPHEPTAQPVYGSAVVAEVQRAKSTHTGAGVLALLFVSAGISIFLLLALRKILIEMLVFLLNAISFFHDRFRGYR